MAVTMEKENSEPPTVLYNSAGSAASSQDEGKKTVNNLARQYTNLSRVSVSSLGPIPSNLNPFSDSHDPRLDPFSDNFNARTWAKHVVNLQRKANSNHINRTAGVSFKNLGAYGYGTGSDYQKNVLNIIASAVSSVANIRNKGNKIQILRDFNGVVKQGETCVVLGRPGRYVQVVPIP